MVNQCYHVEATRLNKFCHVQLRVTKSAVEFSPYSSHLFANLRLDSPWFGALSFYDAVRCLLGEGEGNDASDVWLAMGIGHGTSWDVVCWNFTGAYWLPRNMEVEYPGFFLGLLATCSHDGNRYSPIACNTCNHGEIIYSFVQIVQHNYVQFSRLVHGHCSQSERWFICHSPLPLLKLGQGTFRFFQWVKDLEIWVTSVGDV